MDCIGQNKNIPKVLVISSNCFSKTSSNGRTLACLFEKYPKQKLAQFYVKGGVPDFDVCDNYFKVTDKDALKAFLFKKEVGTKVGLCKKEEYSCKIKKSKKNPFTMLIRERIWACDRWMGEKFNQWLNEFNPDVVLLQAGDNFFFLKLATSIAKKFNVPLIMYNSENYYFKKKNYMKNSGLFSLFYPLFIRTFRKEFRRTINVATHSIYNSEELKKLYDKEFNKSSSVIYTSSKLLNTQMEETKNETLRISYLGNLGLGRDKSLIELADIIQKYDKDLKLYVYGKIPNKKVAKNLLSHKSIKYCGFVQYEQVVEIMRSSDILVHAENFSKFSQEDLRYAFSTKIADYLSSGKCLLYYGPENITSTKYLLENNVAFVATNQSEIDDIVKLIIADEDVRWEKTSRAYSLAKKNHNLEINSQKFLEILLKEMMKKGNNEKI